MGTRVMDGHSLAAELGYRYACERLTSCAEEARRSLETADTAESGVVGTRTIYVDRPARGERIVR